MLAHRPQTEFRTRCTANCKRLHELLRPWRELSPHSGKHGLKMSAKVRPTDSDFLTLKHLQASGWRAQRLLTQFSLQSRQSVVANLIFAVALQLYQVTFSLLFFVSWIATWLDHTFRTTGILTCRLRALHSRTTLRESLETPERYRLAKSRVNLAEQPARMKTLKTLSILTLR